jgi:hypothetical protein
MLGSDDEYCAGFYAFTHRAPRPYGGVALSGSFFEAGGGHQNPEICRRGPHQSRCERVRVSEDCAYFKESAAKAAALAASTLGISLSINFLSQYSPS